MNRSWFWNSRKHHYWRVPEFGFWIDTSRMRFGYNNTNGCHRIHLGIFTFGWNEYFAGLR